MPGSRPLWSHALQWTVWGIVMSLVMGWLGKTRLREPERTADGVVLRNPASMLVIGLLCVIFFFGAAVASLLAIKHGEGLKIFFAFSAFALLGLPLVADYYRDHHEVGARGLHYQTTFGGAGSASWNDLVKVRYSQGMKWFRLELRNSKVVRISAMMIGLADFAKLLLEHAPAADIDPATRQILEQTAAGNPPRVWR